MMMFSAPAKVPSTALLLSAHQQQQSSSSFATLSLAGEDYCLKSENAFKLPFVPLTVASVKHAFSKLAVRLPRIVPRPGKRDTTHKQVSVSVLVDPFAELAAPTPFAACGDPGSDDTLVVPHPSPAANNKSAKSSSLSSSLSPRLAWASVKARLSRRAAAAAPVAGGNVVVVDELRDEFFADDDDQPAVIDFAGEAAGLPNHRLTGADRAALASIFDALDTNPAVWHRWTCAACAASAGSHRRSAPPRVPLFPRLAHDGNLFDLYQALTSPPDVAADLDVPESMLRSTPYPFQKRTVARMLQVEMPEVWHAPGETAKSMAAPAPDPPAPACYRCGSLAVTVRLPERPAEHQAPEPESAPFGTCISPVFLARRDAASGDIFWIDPRHPTAVFRRAPTWIAHPRAGVLAEDMGMGKTLISIMLILATRDMRAFPADPNIPVRFHAPPDEGELDQAPRVAKLKQLSLDTVELPVWSHHKRELRAPESDLGSLLRSSFHTYTDTASIKVGRVHQIVSTEVVLLPTTLVAVPDTLLYQWQNELAKHVDGSHKLSCLALNPNVPLPRSPAELLAYDLLLVPFSKINALDKTDVFRRSHFLRLIVDEGHKVGASTDQMRTLQRVRSTFRWIVTGTPTTKLALDAADVPSSDAPAPAPAPIASGAPAIPAIPAADASVVYQKDVAALHDLFDKFLRCPPFVAADPTSETRSSSVKALFKSRAPGVHEQLFNALSRVFVRHQREDLVAATDLPPLHEKTVWIQPTWFDAMSFNAMLATLITNALETERTSSQYLFRKENKKELDLYRDNLRRATTMIAINTELSVFLPQSVIPSILAQEHGALSRDDRDALNRARTHLDRAAAHAQFLALHDLGDLPIIVSGFPRAPHGIGNSLGPYWCMPNEDAAGLDYVPSQTIENLALLFSKQMKRIADAAEARSSNGITAAHAGKAKQQRRQELELEATVARGHQLAAAAADVRPPTPPASQPAAAAAMPRPFDHWEYRKTATDADINALGSQLTNARIRGVSSAKLRYLMSRLLELAPAEKCIVFAELDQELYYVVQLADLLGIMSILCAAGLKGEMDPKEAVRTFATSDAHRVFIVRTWIGARGLDLSVATRVFFLSPVWRFDIVRQAVRRAHRLGQTKPVFVETLAVRGNVLDYVVPSSSSSATSNDHGDPEWPSLGWPSRVWTGIAKARAAARASGTLSMGDLRELLEMVPFMPIDPRMVGDAAELDAGWDAPIGPRARADVMLGVEEEENEEVVVGEDEPASASRKRPSSTEGGEEEPARKAVRFE
ncbi:hypothetical protein H9P43_008164 [Blastocladiella emersonii ATCC 22665]|nr:hypothetical protein H9P43_008164 [Blastocladiella emersonii ATCC 22665]